MTEPKPVSGALLLLDADVLYPIRVCDFILTAASLKLIARPVVSAMTLEEAARNVRADRPDPESAERITRRFDAVRTVVDGFDQPIPKRFVDDSIVNAKDQHVLGAVEIAGLPLRQRWMLLTVDYNLIRAIKWRRNGTFQEALCGSIRSDAGGAQEASTSSDRTAVETTSRIAEHASARQHLFDDCHERQ